MTSATSHLPQYLHAALNSDAARPRLTYYDDASSERVELSAQTLANWVTKTINLLVDDVGVEAGARVSLHLPLHWLAGVWVIALDSVAAELVDEDDHVDVAVVPVRQTDNPDDVSIPTADDVFAVSLAPMAMPLGPLLPAGMRDYCADVRTMPDQIVIAPDHAGGLAEEAAARAKALHLRPQERIAVSSHEGPALVPVLVDGLLAPLDVDGSVVWTRHPDPSQYVSRWRAELVTAVVGELPSGVSLPAETRHLV